MTRATETAAVKPVHVIGGGLAGSEAAWQIAEAGVPAVLHEMRPARSTDAHQTDGLAELVCSNSFRSDDAETNAVGVLHAEMRCAGSLIMRAGDAHRVPAGSALAVDREGFSAAVTDALAAHPLVTVERGEIAGLPDAQWDSVIVATGPLTSPALSEAVQSLTGEDALAFFDAIAPVVHFDSVDMSKAWFQSRYDKGEGADYINCALDRETYHAFVRALVDGEKTVFKEWEESTPYFEGCLPIEVMAERGPETLAHGPMKPVGLTNPHAPETRAYAVAQLRQDNALGTLYNMVGFQTKLKYAEQARVFRMIPGLEHAEFARLGGLHRNTFMNAPRLLDASLRLKAMPRLRFAGQITGCEGYVESAAVGLMAGRFAAAERLEQQAAPPPATTAMGALLRHITGGAAAETYQPMNVNFGLFPPLDETDARGRPVRGRERKKALARRALHDIEVWKAGETGGAPAAAPSQPSS
ncbi:MAG: methylenetetrahydrofolate--tRNA-(uracil(54)-C(5))-methyltransferase (FADH(2)-oxidizing) TrmFO [Rhodospirillales bacterium]